MQLFGSSELEIRSSTLKPDLNLDFLDPPGLECRDPVAYFGDPGLAEWADPEQDLDFR